MLGLLLTGCGQSTVGIRDSERNGDANGGDSANGDTAGDNGGDTTGDSGSNGGDTTPTGSIVLYNGESVPFASAGPWDENNSTIANTNGGAHSNPNHLTFDINVSGWWGAVAYHPASTITQNWSSFAYLEFYAQADTPTTLNLWLVDADDNQSNSPTSVALPTNYAHQAASLTSLSAGVDLSRITSVVFSISGVETGTFEIDVDDLTLTPAKPELSMQMIPTYNFTDVGTAPTPKLPGRAGTRPI
ncbi:MAG: hypothetical protein R3C68_18565 [Myxococcota bacterium]